jgi:hypothetical protein
MERGRSRGGPRAPPVTPAAGVGREATASPSSEEPAAVPRSAEGGGGCRCPGSTTPARAWRRPPTTREGSTDGGGRAAFAELACALASHLPVPRFLGGRVAPDLHRRCPRKEVVVGVLDWQTYQGVPEVVDCAVGIVIGRPRTRRYAQGHETQDLYRFGLPRWRTLRPVWRSSSALRLVLIEISARLGTQPSFI